MMTLASPNGIEDTPPAATTPGKPRMRSSACSKEDDAFLRRIDARRREHLKRRHIVAAEARIDALDQHEAAHQQPRAHGEHQRRRHFHDHERAAHASARARPPFPSALAAAGRES